jgi:transposase
MTVAHERVDDLPAIITHLKNMRVAELWDNHVPPKGHGQGWRLGGTTVVWLACILSEGDHRLSRVEPWVKAHRRPLRRCLGRQVKSRDLTDERLATPLDSLGGADRWVVWERARHQAVLRVYDWQGRLVRVDTTTAAASVTPAGLCQLGHSKEHRPDLPQVQSAMAVRDPLGLPLTPTGVAGQTADAPRALPEMAKVRQSARTTGLTDVGACKMAARGTRAESVAHQVSSVCPLSAQQRPEAARARVLAPVWGDPLAPSAIRLPNAAGACAETDAPVALGFTSTVARRASEPCGQSPTGPERRLGVRSLALAASQEQSWRQRVARAVTALNALDERQQGTPRWPAAAAADPAAAAIRATHRVAGLVPVTVTTAVHEHVPRRYGTRPATTVRRERVRGCATGEETPLAQTVQRLGWRVAATKHIAEGLSVAQGVAA